MESSGIIGVLVSVRIQKHDQIYGTATPLGRWSSSLMKTGSLMRFYLQCLIQNLARAMAGLSVRTLKEEQLGMHNDQ